MSNNANGPLILGIESSCDETAAAVVAHGTHVLSNVIATQHELHRIYSGVVPEIASRAHLERIVPVIREAMRLADAKYEELDAIAVGNRPGLIGSLLVGVSAAKSLAWSLKLPIIGIDHIIAHLHAGLLDTEPVEYPAIGLVASGGHTSLFLVRGPLDVELLGKTIDDAVGEAFDKVARMLDLPYPGGPEISRLAKISRKRKDLSRDIVLPTSESVKLPRPMLNTNDCDFSFSGLKTAVLYAIKNLEMTTDVKEKFAREFEDAVVEILIKKTKRAIDETKARTLVIGGGVSANDAIREAFERLVSADMPDLTLHTPAQGLSTDNAIMIGISGYFGHLAGKNIDPADLTAKGNLRLSG
ncbi:tRNA (adenosine(37)-N6)-threonylcarbamoyltransferase complex transferase subunit TsaD [Patescibacteria group bacterium]|nr:tRNA (adenosine(37)-N6)-threonylcarbamoyltransferase complex transferase subunit TsaD [Patescibacteria group bacterium]